MPTVVTIVGNLTKDPEEKDYGSNKNVTKLRVACSDRYKTETGEWKSADTAYYNVSAWRGLGKTILNTFKKGDKIIVHGKMKYTEFKREDGTLANYYDIEAIDVGIGLKSQASEESTDNAWSKKTISTKSNEENPWA